MTFSQQLYFNKYSEQLLIILLSLLPATKALPNENPTEKLKLSQIMSVSPVGDKIFARSEDDLMIETNLDVRLQQHLERFLTDHSNPIATVVVSEIATGRILGMVEGRPSKSWSNQNHGALHNLFPAASLFKTIVTAAALELTSVSSEQLFGLPGGCGSQDITAQADWLVDDRGESMSLKRAFGHSCNSFFAKIAVNQLGVGGIQTYAKKFGWERDDLADFSVPASRFIAPDTKSGTYTVGRFAAGFGHVGISAVHANWIALALGNKGKSVTLKLIKESNKPVLDVTAETARKQTDLESSLTETVPNNIVVTEDTASQLLSVMKSTVQDGTASNTFWRPRYRGIASESGGKTGTLRGRSPEGLTTLFFGVYPISAPKIAVSSIVVMDPSYSLKASQLAAEAIYSWNEFENSQIP